MKTTAAPALSSNHLQILPPGRLTLVGKFGRAEQHSLQEDHRRMGEVVIVRPPPTAPPAGTKRDPFGDTAISSGVMGFTPLGGGRRLLVWDRLWSFPGDAAPDVEASWWAEKARDIGAFGVWPGSAGYAFFEPDGRLGADVILRGPATGGHLLKIEVALYSAAPFRLTSTLQRGIGIPDRIERIRATPAGGSGEYQVVQAWALRSSRLQFSLRWDEVPESSPGIGLYHLRVSRGLGIGVSNP